MNNLFLDRTSKKGIGEVFKDLKDKILLQFSNEMSVESVVHAKLLVLAPHVFYNL